MVKQRRIISLGFTEERVQEGLHICYIYHDDVERLRVMAHYLRSGLQCDEKLLYLVDSMTPKAMVEYLRELGVVSDMKPSALTVLESESVYAPLGIFKADEMLDIIRRFYRDAVAEGYQGARGTGEMSWCLANGRVDKDALWDYEARLNDLLVEYPYTACCQYDARRFSGQTILDVLSVHPVAIIRGQLVKNPFYIEPALFLQEYHNRMKGTR